ncbi:MAG: DUF418 domain-containing protein [Thermoleophilaceae bacterium]|nr:DUF418 domain-containing protein [Thermoleophilaceae bacterium]
MIQEVTPAAPPAPPQRIQLVDALRGFALFGILAVNIVYFATAYGADTGLVNPQSTSWADSATSWITAALFETKFYLLFSLLFGYSFVLQMQSAERQGKPFKRRMLRRLIGLFVIGSLHAVFLWHGDILTLYSVLGLLLLWCRNIKPRTAIKAAVITLVVIAGGWILSAFLVSGDPTFLELDSDEERAYALEMTAALRGSFGEVLSFRLTELAEFVGVIFVLQGPIAFAMFLIGLAAAKTGVFESVDRYRPGFKKLLAIGLPIGLLGGIVFAWTTLEAGVESPWVLAGLGITTLTAPLLMGSYVAIFALSAASQPGQKVIALLAPMGRMALSNYVLQSILMGLVFFGYGLGQFGRLSPFEVLLVTIAIYAVLLAFSTLWMQRHAYGPLEWLLRAFTNWERPAWRVPVSTIAP